MVWCPNLAERRERDNGASLLNELAGQILGEAGDVLRAEKCIDVLDMRRVFQAADRVDRVEPVGAQPAFKSGTQSWRCVAAHAATGPTPS